MGHIYSVFRTAQSMLSYLAYFGADVSAFVPFCPAQFNVTHCLHLYCSVWAKNWWWHDVTMPISGMVCHLLARMCYDQPLHQMWSTKIRKGNATYKNLGGSGWSLAM